MLTALVFLLVLAIRPGLILTPLADLFVMDRPNSGTVDAVAVLSGGTPDRVLQARDMIRTGRAKVAVLFTVAVHAQEQRLRELGVNLPREHEINRELLRNFGIPDDRIVVLPGAVDSTWDEARAFARFARERKIKSAVISTCVFHTRRAWLNFQKATEDYPIQLYVSPSPYCEQRRNRWWTERDQIKMLYVESANSLAFYLGRR